MRLGIRRKLIGTLMLVGLLPLALSLVVILGGGATMRLLSIHNDYQHKAADAADQISSVVAHELETLEFLSNLPQVQSYALERTRAHAQRRGISGVSTAAAVAFSPDEFSRTQDQAWQPLTPDREPLHGILNNPLADSLRLLTNSYLHPRHLMVTDRFGELIAADVKTDDYFQADEDWWQQAFNEGSGQPYVSSVVPNPAGGPSIVALAVPIYDPNTKTVIGVLKDKIDSSWLRQSLDEIAADRATPPTPSAQLFDLAATKDHTVLTSDNDSANDAIAAEAEFQHRGPKTQPTLFSAIFGELILGTAPVSIEHHLQPTLSKTIVPRWIVLVSCPAAAAMTPVYRLALSVAAIGVALILVLFILGVAISHREIIVPILRLREAAAAVGRGELNVRLMSDQPTRDPTFRHDELGDLAHDFDDMTRELQKNVSALDRSNEAKRRFMELAGHELRTPVTYILGVCQLTQRQMQNADEAAAGRETAPTTTLARNATTFAAAFGKISAKAQRLSRIIDNLLKLVSNDQFTTRLAKQLIDVRAMILQVANDNRPFLFERKQQLVTDIAENLPSIEGDRDKLEDALTNLLSNAIRFSPDGSTIRLSAHAIVGDQIEILVDDAGPGIPAEEAANLFQPFFTGADVMHHHSGTIEYGSKGIGLGLAIVRRFIEIHNGTVRAHPLPGGKGTQFQILLPFVPREALADAAPAAPTGGGTTESL